jgi:hypothetical protein
MEGTCKNCGTPNVELNDEGMCANCAAAAPKTDETATPAA